MLNQCTFIGRLSKEVEIRYTTGGKSVANFTLAIQREVATANSERVSDFLNFVVWGKPAENMANNLSKGDLIALTSRVQTRNYEKDGQRVYITEFVVEGFPKFLKVKKWENGNGGSSGQTNNSNQNSNPYGNQDQDPFSNPGYQETSDDDLPF